MSRKSDLAAKSVIEHQQMQATAQAVRSLYASVVHSADTTQGQMVRQAESDYSSALQRVTSDFDNASQQAEHTYAASVAQITRDLNAARQRASALVKSALAALPAGAQPWDAPLWASHTPPPTGRPPAMLRVGEIMQKQGQFTLPALPALIPAVGTGGRHILASFEIAQTGIGAGLIESLAWRIAALSPPGTSRFLLIDPLDSGTNLASLLKLPEGVRGSKIYWGEQEIEEALRSLTSEMEEVLQRRLLNTFRNIEEYNTANPQVAVPYRFVVVAGFPKRFSSRSADLLYSLARSGPRAGCYLIAGLLRGEKPPHDFDFQSFARMATYISIKGNHVAEWTDPTYGPVIAKLDPLPSVALTDQMATAVGSQVSASQSQGVPFQQIAVRKAKWWQASSEAGLEADIGIDESGNVFRLNIGGGGGSAQHALVGGTTNMGKTNLLHLLVLSLATAYGPDDLQLYLVDFKGGVEFQDYATYDLPHVRAVVLEAEREFGLSVLQHMEQEMERRSLAFKAAGVSTISEYRQKSGSPMSRIMLIVDEYVVLFSEDDFLSQRASEALGSLVMRGRAFGIHVLLSAQRPASSFLSMTNIKSQMGLRVALKCRPDDSTLILGEGNEKAARLRGAGEAYITSDPDRAEASVHVRTARVTRDDRLLYLRGLREFVRLQGYTRSEPVIVFNRDAAAPWLGSRKVAARLSATSLQQVPSPLFWLGQPLRLAEDAEVALHAAQGANMMVLGINEALAMRVLICSILGLALTTPPSGEGAGRYLVIGAPDLAQPGAAQLQTMQAMLPHKIEVLARQEAVAALADLATEVDTRMAASSAARERVFVVIAGLHRWLEARGPNSYTPGVAGEGLVKLASQGPPVGIHTLVWCDRTATLAQVVSSSNMQDTLAQLGHRVSLHTNADDSFNFLGSPAASKLTGDRAFYRNESWPADVLEKLKPYTLPSPDELRDLLSALKTKWG